mmetsp:Transcript_67078/g.185766  ORF Transcript_67078/g.185766 Transcript_67078/m.185766 type:complete len:267 (+) Transcript_67078:30-830(+)
MSIHLSYGTGRHAHVGRPTGCRHQAPRISAFPPCEFGYPGSAPARGSLPPTLPERGVATALPAGMELSWIDGPRLMQLARCIRRPPAQRQTPAACMASFFCCFRCLKAPRSQRWQKWQSLPLVQPFVCMKAHGRHSPVSCPAEPMLGNPKVGSSSSKASTHQACGCASGASGASPQVAPGSAAADGAVSAATRVGGAQGAPVPLVRWDSLSITAATTTSNPTPSGSAKSTEDARLAGHEHTCRSVKNSSKEGALSSGSSMNVFLTT